MNNKKINETDSLQAIYSAFLKAVSSVVNILRPYLNQQDGKLTNSWWAPIPLSFSVASYVPRWPSVRLSPWNYVRNEELPSIKEVLRQYRPLAFNPLNLIPPLPKVARIFDGKHLITFDGKLVTLPGTLQYVLAQDVVNGNFSIVANVVDDQLKSIAVVDKNGDTVEVSADGPVKVNGEATEFPVHQNQLHAWREYYSFQILSNWGAHVHCKADLKVCHIYVNGFYHNQVRGLLGNANAEPNYGWQLPSGIITKSLNEAAEAYKLQKGQAVKLVAHDHAKDDAESAECAEVFGWGSPLRAGYYFIDVQPYREACAHSVASSAKKLDAACDVAFAYVSVCRTENIPATMPEKCQKCRSVDASGKPVEHNLYEFYNIVNPQKKADIVLVVDTALGEQLNELVDSTISELRKELKSRDISDAHIAVIGYNREEKYLSKFTSKGKLDYTGKFSVPKWKSSADLKVDDPINVGGYDNFNKASKTANSFLRQLEDDLGLSADGRAFRKALQYPFRADAGKAILAIRSDSLTYSFNPVNYSIIQHLTNHQTWIYSNFYFSHTNSIQIKSLGANFASSFAAKRGINVHAITPMQNLTTDNQKDVKQLVGFTNKLVLQLSDAKKRSNFGSTDLRSHINYGRDLGIDAVQNIDTGYSFSLTNYLGLADKDKKQFINVAANALADQLARTEVINDCVCYLKHGMYAHDQCVVRESKQLPPIVSFNYHSLTHTRITT